MKNILAISRLVSTMILFLALAACGSSESEEAFVEAVQVNELDITSLSISIEFNNTILEAGTTSRARAIAQRSGGQSDLDVSSSVNWSSSDSSVLSVDNVGNIQAASGIDSQATLFAELADLSANQILTVSTEDLDQITITRADGLSSDFRVCSPQNQLIATGEFAPGDDRVITNQVVWATSTTNLARIDQAGVVSALATGTASFTATRDTITSAPLPIGIDDQLDTITVVPADSTIQTNGTQQYTANGNYDDLTILDITETVQWAENSAGATVTIAQQGGLATAVAVGDTTVTATCNAITSDPADISVIAPVNANGVEIRLNSSPDLPNFEVGDGPIQLRAFLLFTNGSIQEITLDDDTDWSVARVVSGIGATVNNIDGDNDKGEISFTGEGVTEIQIIYNNGTQSFEDDVLVTVENN